MENKQLNNNKLIHYTTKKRIIFCDSNVAINKNNTTNNLNKATCPKCISLIKDRYWYCSLCGYIMDESVNYSTRCTLCGGELK